MGTLSELSLKNNGLIKSEVLNTLSLEKNEQLQFGLRQILHFNFKSIVIFFELLKFHITALLLTLIAGTPHLGQI